MKSSFWQGKRVLVTGHTGFKGGWLSLWLSEMGADVYGFALAPATQPNLFELANVERCLHSTIGDIRDQQALSAAVTAAQPEIVFHLAAQPLVRLSYSDPLSTFDTNVMGTARLLECIRTIHSVKAVVVVTSDKCYQNTESATSYDEQHPLGGHDPYSASKACAELVVDSWRNSFFTSQASPTDTLCAIATARAGNVIGGGDWSQDRLIPDVLESINNNQPIVLRNPDAIRPWQHVLEPVAGCLLLAERLYTEGQAWAQPWNFGPDESDMQSVSWIVNKLINVIEPTLNWIHDQSVQLHETQILKLDSSKAHGQLGWKNIWSLDECINEIVTWNLQLHAGEDMNTMTKLTIERYVQKLFEHDVTK